MYFMYNINFMKFFDFKLTVNSSQASEYWGAWSHISALLNKKEGQGLLRSGTETNCYFHASRRAVDPV